MVNQSSSPFHVVEASILILHPRRAIIIMDSMSKVTVLSVLVRYVHWKRPYSTVLLYELYRNGMEMYAMECQGLLRALQGLVICMTTIAHCQNHDGIDSMAQTP